MDLQTTLISAATFIGGLITTKLIEAFFDHKKKVEEKVEATEEVRLQQLEATVRSMELTLATLTGKLELLIPNMNAMAKLKEDMAGFYQWKRSQGEQG